MRLLLLSLLVWQTLSGQSSICYNYSIHDPCPDPKKNHIASRTIYTARTNEVLPCVDTTFEKYDRNGNLVTLEFFKASNNKLQIQRVEHRFLHDDQQRIVQENHLGNVVIKYTYSSNGDTIRVDNPTAYYSNDVVRSVIWYDRVQGDTNAIGIDSKGDTIYRLYASSMQRIEKTFQRNQYGAMTIADSSVTYTRPDMRYVFNFYADPNGETSTTMHISRFDKKHRVSEKEYLVDNNFTKNRTHFEYNRKGRIERTTTTTYPFHYPAADTEISVWETKYYYNTDGKLAQTQGWNHDQPNLIELTSYIYTENKLLSEIHRLKLDRGAIVEEEREHWVYTYY